MAKRNISKEELQKRITQANEERNELRRARHEYDLKYRRSVYFKVTLIIRIASAVFCACVVALSGIDFYSEYDQIVSSKVEQEVIVSNVPKPNTMTYFDKYVHIGTRSGGKYMVSLGESGKASSFLTGDSVLVHHTLFHVPSYISTSNKKVYMPTKQFDFFRPLAVVFGIFSLLSVFVTSGFDKLSRYFVGFVTLLSTAVVVFYFAM